LSAGIVLAQRRPNPRVPVIAEGTARAGLGRRTAGDRELDQIYFVASLALAQWFSPCRNRIGPRIANLMLLRAKAAETDIPGRTIAVNVELNTFASVGWSSGMAPQFEPFSNSSHRRTFAGYCIP